MPRSTRTAEEGRNLSLTVREVIALPAQAAEVCAVAEEFLRDWVPAVALSDVELEPQLIAAQSRLGAPSPSVLRWLYSRLGASGGRLFQQDPIVHLESLMVDEDGVVTFRTEQQGCVEWGYQVMSAPDPAVVIKNHMTAGLSSWQPFQNRLAIHVLEGVLSEAMFCSGTHIASLDPTPQASEALEQLAPLGIPPHPSGPQETARLLPGGTDIATRWYEVMPATGYGHSARPKTTCVG